MQFLVSGSTPFRPESSGFSIGPSGQDYTLQVTDAPLGIGSESEGAITIASAVYQDVAEVEAGDRLDYVAATAGLWYRLYGNTDDVIVTVGKD